MIKLRSQQGLALITVLMIFAIASVLAVAMVERQATDMQRSSTLFTVQQAREFVLGAEDAVKAGLYLSWKQDKEKDHLFEEWAKERRFPLMPGMVYIRITDAQGRFNINTLSPQANNHLRQRQRFVNLLNLLGADPAIAQSLSNWFNPESQADDIYQGYEPPYRAAYQQCKHTSEVMLIEGMTLELYQRIEPFIACLPITAALNVNTASNLVLASMSSELTLAQADNIIQQRGDKGFASVDEFMQLPDIEPLTKASEDKKPQNDSEGGTNNHPTRFEAGDFSVKSEFFEAFIRVDLNERIASSEVLLHREAGNGDLETLYRDFSRREARLVPKIDTGASQLAIPDNLQ